MRQFLRRVRCLLGGGHLPVTKSGQGKVHRSCFLCDSKLGSGWNFTGVANVPKPTDASSSARVLPMKKRA